MGVSAIPPERPLINFSPTGVPPDGYIKANGATLSRAVYAWLFSKIGTIYGAGDGSTTFKIPDYRGEFLRGLDDGRGVDAGRLIGSAQADEIKLHSHGMRSGTGTGSNTRLTQSAFFNTASGSTYQTDGDAAGGNETRPRNVSGLFCIAYAP